MTNALYNVGRNSSYEEEAMEKAIEADKEAALLRSGQQVYANWYGYSDVHPFEVVRVISATTIEIRMMTATKDPSWTPIWDAGGFTAHCSNQHEQRWFYQSDPNARVERIRKGKQGWKKGEFRISDKPRRFHDYNF